MGAIIAMTVSVTGSTRAPMPVPIQSRAVSCSGASTPDAPVVDAARGRSATATGDSERYTQPTRFPPRSARATSNDGLSFFDRRIGRDVLGAVGVGVSDVLDEGVIVVGRAAPRRVIPDRLPLCDGIGHINALPDPAPVEVREQFGVLVEDVERRARRFRRDVD